MRADSCISMKAPGPLTSDYFVQTVTVIRSRRMEVRRLLQVPAEQGRVHESDCMRAEPDIWENYLQAG